MASGKLALTLAKITRLVHADVLKHGISSLQRLPFSSLLTQYNPISTNIIFWNNLLCLALPRLQKGTGKIIQTPQTRRTSNITTWICDLFRTLLLIISLEEIFLQPNNIPSGKKVREIHLEKKGGCFVSGAFEWFHGRILEQLYARK